MSTGVFRLRRAFQVSVARSASVELSDYAHHAWSVYCVRAGKAENGRLLPRSSSQVNNKPHLTLIPQEKAKSHPELSHACLLFNSHGVKNSCSNGDALYHVSDGRERKKVYDALRRAGLSYDENIRALIGKAASIGMLPHLIDLSLDATHLMYHGAKRLKEWGA